MLKMPKKAENAENLNVENAENAENAENLNVENAENTENAENLNVENAEIFLTLIMTMPDDHDMHMYSHMRGVYTWQYHH